MRLAACQRRRKINLIATGDATSNQQFGLATLSDPAPLLWMGENRLPATLLRTTCLVHNCNGATTAAAEGALASDGLVTIWPSAPPLLGVFFSGKDDAIERCVEYIAPSLCGTSFTIFARSRWIVVTAVTEKRRLFAACRGLFVFCYRIWHAFKENLVALFHSTLETLASLPPAVADALEDESSNDGKN